LAVTTVTTTAAQLVSTLENAFDAFEDALDAACEDFNHAPEDSPDFPEDYPQELTVLRDLTSAASFVLGGLLSLVEGDN
jgi:hypothetical protein